MGSRLSAAANQVASVHLNHVGLLRLASTSTPPAHPGSSVDAPDANAPIYMFAHALHNTVTAPGTRPRIPIPILPVAVSTLTYCVSPPPLPTPHRKDCPEGEDCKPGHEHPDKHVIEIEVETPEGYFKEGKGEPDKVPRPIFRPKPMKPEEVGMSGDTWCLAGVQQCACVASRNVCVVVGKEHCEQQHTTHPSRLASNALWKGTGTTPLWGLQWSSKTREAAYSIWPAKPSGILPCILTKPPSSSCSPIPY